MILDREGKAAYLSTAEFSMLDEYSCSIPSGTWSGKIWKRRIANGSWWLGQMGEVDGANILLHWYEIFINVGAQSSAAEGVTVSIGQHPQYRMPQAIHPADNPTKLKHTT